MLVMGHAFARRLKANKREDVNGPRTTDASGALAGLRSRCSLEVEAQPYRCTRR